MVFDSAAAAVRGIQRNAYTIEYTDRSALDLRGQRLMYAAPQAQHASRVRNGRGNSISATFRNSRLQRTRQQRACELSDSKQCGESAAIRQCTEQQAAPQPLLARAY